MSIRRILSPLTARLGSLGDTARAAFARHHLSGALVLRFRPAALPAGLTRALLDAVCAARPGEAGEAGWPALDLLTTCALRDADGARPRALLTFDDAAADLERGPLLADLEARALSALALLDLDHIDEEAAGVSRHTLRWMLGAGVAPGLWVPQAAVGLSAARLRQRLHDGSRRLRACCGVARPWIATDAAAADPWLKAAAADLGLPYLLTARAGLWPAAPPAAAPVEVPRLTLSPDTAPSALYDLLRASPAALTRAVLWRKLTSP